MERKIQAVGGGKHECAHTIRVLNVPGFVVLSGPRLV